MEKDINETALFFACRSGNEGLVRDLVERGLDIHKEMNTVKVEMNH